MSPCQTLGNAVICGPSMVEGLREVGPCLWCFHCREYRMHYTVRMDGAEPGWYGSSWSQRCDRCDSTAQDFLGNTRFVASQGGVTFVEVSR